MHPMQLAERLKNLPDEALMREMQSEPGSAPKYVVMAEMERRKGIRKYAGGGPVEWKHQEQYGPPAELNRGPVREPDYDRETYRALEEIRRRKRPWYQMGPENTFLTPERTKAAAAAYHSQPWITFNGQARSPGDPSALRERGAGYDAATAAPATPNQPAPTRPVGIAAARIARPAGPSAPPVAAGPYPEPGPVRNYEAASQGIAVDPALADAAGQETGGYGVASAGLGALLTSTTTPGKRPGSFEEYMKQAEAANPDGLAGMREKYMAMMDEQKTSKEQMGWNAMLRAGIGMMGTKSSRFLDALAPSASAALNQWEMDLKNNRGVEKDRLAAEMDFAKYGATRSANINKTARELRRQDIDDDRYDQNYAHQQRMAGVAERGEAAKARNYDADATYKTEVAAQYRDLRKAQAEKARADAAAAPIRANAAAVSAAKRGGNGVGGSGALRPVDEMRIDAILDRRVKAGQDEGEVIRQLREQYPGWRKNGAGIREYSFTETLSRIPGVNKVKDPNTIRFTD